MIKVLFHFVIFAVLFGVCINAFRHLTGKEKWDLTKLVVYALFCAVLSGVVLTAVVLLF